MLISEENIKALSDLGLSPNKAKVYLSILQTDGLSIHEISKTTKIAREDVYRIIPKLEEIGLTERVMGNPVKVRTLPVEKALSNLIKVERGLFAEKIAATEVGTSNFLKRYRIKGDEATGTLKEDSFILLTAKNAIVNKGFAMIENAKIGIDATYSETQLAQFVPIFADPLETACKKGVTARLIVDKKIEERSTKKVIESYLHHCGNLQLKYAEGPTSHSLIVDCTQALSATVVEGYFSQIPHLWTNSRGIVELLEVNFESAWQVAEPEILT